MDAGASTATGEQPAEDLLAAALKGWSAFKVAGALNINLVCSGFVIRKGGPLGLPATVPGPGANRAVHFDLVAQRVYVEFLRVCKALFTLVVQ